MPRRHIEFIFRILYILFFSITCSTSSAPDHDLDHQQLVSRNPAQGVFIDQSGYAFDPNDTSCDGFPALKVQTMSETCLGIVMYHGNNTQNNKLKLKKPRTIVRIPGSVPDEFLVTDMGGWGKGIGSLFLLKQNNEGKYQMTELMAQLDLPHGLAFNKRDQFFYLGENNKIIRFKYNFKTSKIQDLQTVVKDMADVAKHLHPLTHFVFSPKTGDLYVNSGAPNDHCFLKDDGNYKERCPDEVLHKMAAIQKITAADLKTVTADSPLDNSAFVTVAKGLRNSMAMSIHPFGRFLIQGENSRDFPELEEPYEEMNVIRLDKSERGNHFGWPYCYNNHATSPEWNDLLIKDKSEYLKHNPQTLAELHGPNPFYCGRRAIENKREYQRPFTLVPPHAAPLASEYYNGEMFKDLFGGDLLVSWHGYRSTGQRLVSYKVSNQGLPLLKKPENEYYNFNLPNGCSKKAPFKPRGGLRNHVLPYTEIISGWGAVKNIRPKGAPVGFAEGSDGAIWIVEDKNQTIVRLARNPVANFQQPGCNDKEAVNNDHKVPLLAWRNAIKEDPKLHEQFEQIRNELRQSHRCLDCHGTFASKSINQNLDLHAFTTLDLFIENDWLKPGSLKRSLLYTAITHSGTALPMPMGYDSLSEDQAGQDTIKLVESWINGVPADVADRWQQTTSKKNSNIRAIPTTQGNSPCGQFKKDDIIYVDPRPKSNTVNKYRWSKVYLVPDHSRLWNEACAYPDDGVFWIAL